MPGKGSTDLEPNLERVLSENPSLFERAFENYASRNPAALERFIDGYLLKKSLKELMIVANRTAIPFATEVVEELNKIPEVKSTGQTISLANISINNFPNSELNISSEDSIRHRTVFAIGQWAHDKRPKARSIHDDFAEYNILLKMLSGIGVNAVISVLPELIYDRQDRAEVREPISIKWFFDTLNESGGSNLKRYITVDPHSKQIQLAAGRPVDIMSAMGLLAGYFARLPDLSGKELVAVSPDVGGTGRAKVFARTLGAILNQEIPIAIIDKERKKGELAKAGDVVGQDRVNGRVAIVVDDKIDTGGTIDEGARSLLLCGAIPPIYAGAPHCILSDSPKRNIPTTQFLFERGIKVVGVGTVYRPDKFVNEAAEWFTELSYARYIAHAIWANFTRSSFTNMQKLLDDELKTGKVDIRDYVRRTAWQPFIRETYCCECGTEISQTRPVLVELDGVRKQAYLLGCPSCKADYVKISSSDK